MIKVDPHSPQGVYDTLLELRLQDWAHEQDAAVSSAHASTLIPMPCDAMKMINIPTDVTIVLKISNIWEFDI